MKFVLAISILLLGTCCHVMGRDLVDELIDTLLNDPHSRELIKNTEKRIATQKSQKMADYDNVNSDVNPIYIRPWRAGDIEKSASDKKESYMKSEQSSYNNVESDISPPWRGGDVTNSASKRKDDLLSQLKSLLEESLQTETKKTVPDDGRPAYLQTRETNKVQRDGILGISWTKRSGDDNAKTSQEKRFNPSPQGLPWQKRDSSGDSGKPKGLPWKRSLHKRLMDDINDLFTMKDAEDGSTETKRSIKNVDKLSDDLSELMTS